MRKLLKNRGYTDKLYFYNFCAVQLIVAAILIITALGGVLGLTDLSPLSNIPQWAYGELGIHTALIVWKAKAENQRKYRFGRNGQSYKENEVEQMPMFEEMEEEDL